MIQEIQVGGGFKKRPHLWGGGGVEFFWNNPINKCVIWIYCLFDVSLYWISYLYKFYIYFVHCILIVLQLLPFFASDIKYIKNQSEYCRILCWWENPLLDTYFIIHSVPILLYKMESRKNIWPFHTSCVITKTFSCSPKNQDQSRCSLFRLLRWECIKRQTFWFQHCKIGDKSFIS